MNARASGEIVTGTIIVVDMWRSPRSQRNGRLALPHREAIHLILERRTDGLRTPQPGVVAGSPRADVDGRETFGPDHGGVGDPRRTRRVGNATDRRSSSTTAFSKPRSNGPALSHNSLRDPGQQIEG